MTACPGINQELTSLLSGAYAAVLVPRDSQARFDEAGFRAILTFLLSRGLDRVVVNGATGEYCMTTPQELGRMLAACREILGRQGTFLCAVGAPSLPGSIELGKVAMENGARALLLPMPYFFPYTQEDLHAFCADVAAALPAPMLLYNLPRFTTPLALETVRHLIDSVPNLIGIKDSSGSLDLLAGLDPLKAYRIVGDDSVLVAALDAGLCDCVISGVAGVLPELTRFLVHARGTEAYPAAVGLLSELIGRLSVFPTPWGLKLIARCRGIATPEILQPLSPGRERQARDFRSWFTPWWSAGQEVLKAPD